MAVNTAAERQAWISKAKALLDNEQKKLVEGLQVGSWVLHTGESIVPSNVFKTKAAALDCARGAFANTRKNFGVERLSFGSYCYSYRSPDDGEEYHFYIEQITSSNILNIVENAITSMLPEEYFSPYSKLYNILH